MRSRNAAIKIIALVSIATLLFCQSVFADDWWSGGSSSSTIPAWSGGWNTPSFSTPSYTSGPAAEQPSLPAAPQAANWWQQATSWFNANVWQPVASSFQGGGGTGRATTQVAGNPPLDTPTPTAAGNVNAQGSSGAQGAPIDTPAPTLSVAGLPGAALPQGAVNLPSPIGNNGFMLNQPGVFSNANLDNLNPDYYFGGGVTYTTLANGQRVAMTNMGTDIRTTHLDPLDYLAYFGEHGHLPPATAAQEVNNFDHMARPHNMPSMSDMEKGDIAVLRLVAGQPLADAQFLVESLTGHTPYTAADFQGENYLGTNKVEFVTMYTLFDMVTMGTLVPWGQGQMSSNARGESAFGLNQRTFNNFVTGGALALQIVGGASELVGFSQAGAVGLLPGEMASSSMAGNAANLPKGFIALETTDGTGDLLGITVNDLVGNMGGRSTPVSQIYLQTADAAGVIQIPNVVLLSAGSADEITGSSLLAGIPEPAAIPATADAATKDLVFTVNSQITDFTQGDNSNVVVFFLSDPTDSDSVRLTPMLKVMTGQALDNNMNPIIITSYEDFRALNAQAAEAGVKFDLVRFGHGVAPGEPGVVPGIWTLDPLSGEAAEISGAQSAVNDIKLGGLNADSLNCVIGVHCHFFNGPQGFTAGDEYIAAAVQLDPQFANVPFYGPDDAIFMLGAENKPIDDVASIFGETPLDVAQFDDLLAELGSPAAQQAGGAQPRVLLFDPRVGEYGQGSWVTKAISQLDQIKLELPPWFFGKIE